MKFENIEVGDIVYVAETVSYGFSRGRSFIIPKKVIRTTRTQFIIDGGRRFDKKRGLEIGSYSSADSEGVDQTHDKELFQAKIKLRNQVYSISNQINLVAGRISPDKVESVNELRGAVTYLKEARKILDKIKSYED